MATSYYIYIKSDVSQGQGSGNFTPKPVKPDNGGDNDIDTEQGSGFGAAALSKVASKFKGIGIATAIIMILKIAAKTTEAVSSYMSKETGNYVFNRNLNNALTTVNVLSNPLGTTMSIINQEQEIRLTNQRLSEQRVLWGDSTLTQGTRKV